ncbi:hypothetical protein DW192_15785 [Segatella copri]|uniref:Uncharacterized protein n=1 Tax=Segatella copri TaxID=165179 RepID=A0A414XL07_9BACT|nr:hypothetical protein DW192_15785 [Segatella copri]
MITHSFTIKLKHGANIREIYDIAKEFLVFNIEVPQIPRMNTDLRDLFGQMTQFFRLPCPLLRRDLF